MAFIIVSGPPCSGKSTYVRERLGEKDVVFDYDKVANAVTGRDTHTLLDKRHARTLVLAMRAAAVEAYRRGCTGIRDFYMITSSQSPVFWAAMEELAPTKIEMEADLETCLQWLAGDDTRPEKQMWENIIRNWFERKEKKMLKEAVVSNDGKTITFYVITEIAPDRTVYNWDTGKYELRESVTSQRYFAEKLAGATAEQTVELYINSMGGDVKEALGIVNVLKRCPAKVIAYVDGFAASAASVITQGADQVWMPKNTCMMLHNARWWTEGNPKELRKSADDLEVINQTIINSYAIRAGDKLSAQKLQEILDAETWLTAEECVQYGLADGIASYDADMNAAAEQFKAAASAGAAAYVTAPPSIAALVTVPGGGLVRNDSEGRTVRKDKENCDPPAGAPENHRSRPGIRLLNALEKMEV